uniref:TolC family protein n=1 Tax=Palpitomonas bilix TaxID=652834 RepID=A0A7S3DDL6_9EUKA|mmetsp:Transcript_331/g.482  ORF Transcript_331/g.482 Transcript_331/m.482 type:complete len:326 (+) Transcript_331:111-1088(+)
MGPASAFFLFLACALSVQAEMIKLDESQAWVGLKVQEVISRINSEELYDNFMLMRSVLGAVENTDAKRYYVDARTELGSFDSIRQFEFYPTPSDSLISNSVSFVVGSAIKNFYSSDEQPYTSYSQPWYEVATDMEEIASCVKVIEKRYSSIVVDSVIHAEMRSRSESAELAGLDRAYAKFEPRVRTLQAEKTRLAAKLAEMEAELSDLEQQRAVAYTDALSVQYDALSAERDSVQFDFNDVSSELTMKEWIVDGYEQVKERIVAEFEPARTLPKSDKTFGVRTYTYVLAQVRAKTGTELTRREFLLYEDRFATLEAFQSQPFSPK